MDATAEMKAGRDCDLLSRLAAETQFGLSDEEMKELLKPKLYIGRCEEQVNLFLEKLQPILSAAEKQDITIDL